MENNISAMILLSYAISKSSKKGFSRRLKVLLPRKKTSSKRIGMNYHWNLLEEASQRKYKLAIVQIYEHLVTEVFAEHEKSTSEGYD